MKELLECGNEIEKKGSLLSSKTMSSSSKHENFYTHCNISGHWIEKCWKLHPQLHPKKGKKDMQAPEEEATKEKVVQVATIHEANQEEEQVQVEGSFTWLGKKWTDYLSS